MYDRKISFNYDDQEFSIVSNDDILRYFKLIVIVPRRTYSFQLQGSLLFIATQIRYHNHMIYAHLTGKRK
jgi:hypothetical protein